MEARRDQVVRDIREMERELTDTMRASPHPTGVGRSPFASIEDAANTLGLTAARARVARKLIEEIARDTRDVLDVTREARDAGIPREAVTELVRRGVDLRGRLAKAEGVAMADGGGAGRELPIGTVRRRKDGIEYRKEGRNKWVPVKQGGGKRPAPASPGAPGEKDPDGRTPKERFEHLSARAKAAGVKISGDFDEAKHGHKHIDHLERRVKEHIARKLGSANGGDGDGGSPQGGDGAAGQEPFERDEKGRPVGHDKPESPHEQHALAQEAHDIGAKLDDVEGRLDSPHQKGVLAELRRDVKKVAANPSPQGIDWLNTRVLSFIALVTGVAAGGAVGGLDGAMAGGVQGHATKIAPGGPSAAMQAGQAAVTAAGGAAAKVAEKAGEVKDKAKAAAEQVKGRLKGGATKKSLAVDPMTGRLVIVSADPLVKAAEMKPPGAGWAPIPRSRKGGFRRKMHGKWEYWYPDGRVQLHRDTVAREKPGQLPELHHESPRHEKIHHALMDAVRSLANPKELAHRVWHGVVHTAKEFPTAARAAGKLLDGEPLSRHEKEALVSVGVMVGTAVLYGSTYGAGAGGAALGKKVAMHIAMAALHSQLNTAYTGYAASAFVGKLGKKALYALDLVSKADDGAPAPSKRDADELQKIVEGMLVEMRKELELLTPERVIQIDEAVEKGFRPAVDGALRAPHPVNEHGHRDGLVPGMILHPRERHSEAGPILVKPDGMFEMKGELYKAHALLAALHGTSNHRTTIRRYFKLGGERSTVIPRADIADELRAVMKSRGVVVQRTSDGYSLTGDLRKAGVPEYMMKRGERNTVIDAEAAFDLFRMVSGQESR